MKKIYQVDQESIGKQYQVFTDTDAEKLTKEFNKIKNYFTTELGADLVAGLSKSIGLFGGDALVVPFREAARFAVPLIASVGALALAWKSAAMYAELSALAAKNGGTYAREQSAALMARASWLRGAGAFAVGAPIAAGVGEAIGTAIANRISAPGEAAQAAAEQEMRQSKNTEDAKIHLAAKANDDMLKLLRQQVAEKSKEYLKDVDNWKSALKIEGQVDKLAFDRIMEARRKLTHELLSISEVAAKKANEDIPHTIKDIEQRQRDRWFQSSLPQDQHKAAGIVSDELDRQIRLASELQSVAKDSWEEKEATAAWNRAESLQKQLATMGDQKTAAQALEMIDRRRIESLEDQSKLQKELAKQAEERAHASEAHDLDLEQQRKTIEERLNLVRKDDQGGFKFKSKEEMQQDIAEVQPLLKKFKDDLDRYGKEDFVKSFLGDPRAFEAMAREAERAMASADLARVMASPERMTDFHDKLENMAAQLRLTVPAIVNIEEVTGLSIVTVGVQGLLNEFQKKLNDITTNSEKNSGIETRMKNAELEYAHGRFSAPEKLGSLPEQLAAADLVAAFDKVHRQKAITQEDLADLGEKIKAFQATWVSSWDILNGPSMVKFATSIQTMADALMRKKELLEQLGTTEKPTAEQVKPVEDIKTNKSRRVYRRSTIRRVLWRVIYRLLAVWRALGKR